MAQTDFGGGSNASVAQRARPDTRGSILNDPKARGLFFQVVILAALAWWIWWVRGNTLANLEEQGKSLGFGFLNDIAGFQILPTVGTWLFSYSVGESTYLDVFLIGITNTFVVAFLGIVFASLIGFVMGVFRLSSNIVLRGFATVYVEVFRNIPLLLWLFIFYFAVLRNLPGPRDRTMLWGETVGINIKGLHAPYPMMGESFWLTGVAVLAAIVVWVAIAWIAAARQAQTGQQFPTFWVGLGVLIALPMTVFYATGAPLEWEHPVFKTDGPVFRRGFEQGVGMTIPPEMIAVWGALTLYTSAFIAEIVRAGILAVNKGQTEASYALGLRAQPTLNLVIIPQALRVIIPPLTSQFLNLTKNSSLAVAVAYPELVSIFTGTALNQVGKEIEMIFMMMLVYLTFSLATAAFMGWFNNRMKLVER